MNNIFSIYKGYKYIAPRESKNRMIKKKKIKN